jgi:hypothetical protein
MTELIEMTKRETSGAVVVQYDIGDSGDIDVGRDANGGEWNALAQLGVDEQEAIDCAADKEVRIFLDEVASTEMAHGEVEIPGLEEIFFDAQHETGEVAFAEFGDDDADCVRKPSAKHAGMDVGAVLKRLRCRENALPGFGRDGFGHGRVIEDYGNGRRRKVKVLGENLESDGFARVGDLLFSDGHETPERCGKRMQQFYTVEIGVWNLRITIAQWCCCKCDRRYHERVPR